MLDRKQDLSSSVHCRMLVADDNKDASASLGMLLRMLGHEVRVVYDGAQAVAEAEAFRPDIVLLDIGMPRLNGYDAAKRIRAQSWGRKMLLVALTGWGQDEDRKRALDAGFNFHFTKPFDIQQLETILDGLKPVATLGEPCP